MNTQTAGEGMLCRSLRFSTMGVGSFCPDVPFRLKDLAWQFQFLFVWKPLVEFFNVNIIHVITLRRLIDPGDVVEVSWNQFLTEKK